MESNGTQMKKSCYNFYQWPENYPLTNKIISEMRGLRIACSIDPLTHYVSE